jgi:hypothetical protein
MKTEEEGAGAGVGDLLKLSRRENKHKDLTFSSQFILQQKKDLYIHRI